MLEKEIKILDIDRSEVEEKLLDMGAEKHFEGYIHDVYYDFPDNNTGSEKMKENGRMFRVRKKGEEHIYTIKNKREDISKQEGLIAKDEHEMKITDVDSFSRVLERYGMKKIREKKKHRVSYNLGGVEFDFDKYDDIPELLEIEGNSIDEINTWVNKLGLESYERLIGGSKTLFKHYNIPYKFL